jgi:ATP-dependent Clp protease protease subunit
MQLPAPEMVNYWRLAENRTFYIDYEIDTGVLEIQKAIININREDKGKPVEKRIPIKIFIQSPGGCLYSTYSLVDTILASVTPVITVNMGIALSGGFLLFIAGSKRYCLSRSQAMLHTGSTGVQGTFEQVEESQKTYRKQIQQMGEYILSRTKIDQKTFSKNKSKDWYFDAAEQVEYGIADSILNSLDEII